MIGLDIVLSKDSNHISLDSVFFLTIRLLPLFASAWFYYCIAFVLPKIIAAK